MMQRTISHACGFFQTCNSCGAEPRHIHSRGRTNSEPPRRPDEPAERHHIECRCGRATGRHATLAEAVGEWGTKWAQTILPLRVARTARRAVA